MNVERRTSLRWLSVGLALGAGWRLARAATPALQPGDAAPDFELDGPGGRRSAASLRGRWVYLDFWASWCGPCRQSFPWMNAVHDRLGPQGLVVVAIGLDAQRADAERFLATTPARFTVLFDGSGATPRTHGVQAMPTSLLIDPDGRLVWRHAGFRPDDRALLEARLSAALASRPSAPR